MTVMLGSFGFEEDYVTRQEFEDMMRRVMPTGDDVTTSVDNSSEGQIIRCILPVGGDGGAAASGDTYKGQFKVTKTGDTTVSVDWGAQPSSPSAGYLVAGDSQVAITKVASLSVPVTGSVAYVYADASYGVSAWDATIVASSAYPSQGATNEVFLLATIVIADSVISEVNQESNGQLHLTRIV